MKVGEYCGVVLVDVDALWLMARLRVDMSEDADQEERNRQREERRKQRELELKQLEEAEGLRAWRRC